MSFLQDRFLIGSAGFSTSRKLILVLQVLVGLFDVVIGSGIPEQPPVATSGNCPLIGLSRSSFMIPESHLVSLFTFLFQVS